MFERGRPARVAPSRLELNTPFCLGETRHYFNQCDLFRSFHAIVEVQFGGLARLDRAINNFKDNLNSLFRHPILMLTVDQVLCNWYCECLLALYWYLGDEWGLRESPCSPNEKHAQVHHAFWQLQASRMTQRQGVQKEGDSPFNAITSHRQSGANQPNQGHCKDPEALACVYEDEAQQVCQKILRCLDVRVMGGDLIVLTCLRMPTLILPTGHFMQLYYHPEAQGWYASQFHSRSQGFLQPRGDIGQSIIPRGFRVLPDDIWEVVDTYFHRQELEDRANRDADDNQEMSTDMEAAMTVRWLQVSDPVATTLLQRAVCDMLVAATAPRPQDPEEFYYDSDDSVLDLDEEYPGLGECVIEWQAAQWGTASLPGWCPPDLGQLEQSCYEKEPDLWEILNQARQARAAGNIPVQSVVSDATTSHLSQGLGLPMPTALWSDCGQVTVVSAGWRTMQTSQDPPQAEPKDALIWDHTQHEGQENHDRGCSRTRDRLDRQLELDRACRQEQGTQ